MFWQEYLLSTVLLGEFETSVLTLLVSTMIGMAMFVLFFSFLRKEKIALNSEVWQPFKLIEIECVSHDVRRYRFALQSSKHILGIPIGQHISFKYVDTEGKDVIRSYTPVTSNDEVGYVDFVIKIYFRNVNPRFPEGGKMSQHLESLQLGDEVLMKGPKGHLEYKGKGKFTIAQKRNQIVEYKKRKIGMVAGGTGITPMLQVIDAIQKDSSDDTELWLIFANQSEEDILLRHKLESIASNKFHLFFTLDRPPSAGWKYGSGFVSPDMCKAYLPPPGPDTMIFLCGPPPMTKSLQSHLQSPELGFNESDIFTF